VLIADLEADSGHQVMGPEGVLDDHADAGLGRQNQRFTNQFRKACALQAAQTVPRVDSQHEDEGRDRREAYAGRRNPPSLAMRTNSSNCRRSTPGA
jgi:hypothetical protein